MYVDVFSTESVDLLHSKQGRKKILQKDLGYLLCWSLGQCVSHFFCCYQKKDQIAHAQRTLSHPSKRSMCSANTLVITVILSFGTVAIRSSLLLFL